jgi:zinc/manganese transport system permease protein
VIDILFPAFLLSTTLVLIHSYFGFKIIERGIIFTDLAIGQAAALGASIALIFLGGDYLYISSLVFSIAAGVVIALLQNRKHIEAFIGLLYAFCLSSISIVLSFSVHGSEIFSRLIANDILFVSYEQVLETGLLYLAIGLVLYFVLPKLSGKLKEILFFTLFATTVTSSVSLAGVLVVFALLISPALIAIKLSKKFLFACSVGTVLNLIAIISSYYLDISSGSMIVAIHSFVAILFFTLIRK